MYLIDYVGRTLSILEQLPHVGAVILNGENECLRRLLTLLSEEMERRKKLVEHDQNMNAYRANYPDSKEAEIIVALAGYSHFAEAFKLQTYTQPVGKFPHRIHKAVLFILHKKSINIPPFSAPEAFINLFIHTHIE